MPVFSTIVKIRDCEDYLVVALFGELDLADAAAVAAALMGAADREPRLVVDLAGLEFIDASGLWALARARNYAWLAGGDLVLAAPQRHVRRILAITALAASYGFSVHASATEAARKFRGSTKSGPLVRYPRQVG